MLDHVGVNVRDIDASRSFYMQALAPLGYEILMQFPEAVGFGRDGRPTFWIVRREPYNSGVHVAFAAVDRASVDQFWRAALDADGTDHGGPGLRPQYHPHYYGAFVLDPDGNNIEAVCHQAE